MENRKLIKFLVVALFTISIQLISVYATPDNNDKQIVSKTLIENESLSFASLNNIKATKH